MLVMASAAGPLIINHSSMDFSQEQTLGVAALAYSLLSRVLPVAVLFIILLVISEPIRVVLPLAARGYVWIVPALVLLAALILALATYLEYSAYRFALDTYALKIRRGFFSTDEIAIPYTKIQDVDIDRPLIYKMFGLSKLVILTAGHDDPKQIDSSEGILNMLQSVVAARLKDELLKRAAVQVVREENNPPRAAA